MLNKFSIEWKPLIISIVIALGAAGISAWITGDSMDVYKALKLPPLAPPEMVFPIVWTVLFILMGISSYLIYISRSKNKKTDLTIYIIQLVVNIIWTPLFFNLKLYLLAFIWLILLWCLVWIMVIMFYRIDKKAALLQIPYLIWLTFAGYLNLAIYLLNR